MGVLEDGDDARLSRSSLLSESPRSEPDQFVSQSSSLHTRLPHAASFRAPVHHQTLARRSARVSSVDLRPRVSPAAPPRPINVESRPCDFSSALLVPPPSSREAASFMHSGGAARTSSRLVTMREGRRMRKLEILAARSIGRRAAIHAVTRPKTELTELTTYSSTPVRR